MLLSSSGISEEFVPGIIR